MNRHRAAWRGAYDDDSGEQNPGNAAGVLFLVGFGNSPPPMNPLPFWKKMVSSYFLGILKIKITPKYTRHIGRICGG